MKLPFDRVIMSSDENRMYLDFWPHVAYAYRALFPGVKITLAFLTERSVGDPLLAELERYGQVDVYRPIAGFPAATQAKMIRHRSAAYSGDQEVCMIDDLDQIPIDRDWYLAKTVFRKPQTLLLVGAEIFGPNFKGQAPASMMTAEGWVFKRLLGEPHSRGSMADWYEYLGGVAQGHTDVRSTNFSDEALVVRLRQVNPVTITHVERGYTVGQNTIDRSCWPYNPRVLEGGGYISAHTARPYRQYKEANDLIIDYIRRRYDGGPMPEPLT